MNSKRGMSPIIATVLLIMLTITAMAIIAGFVVPFVRDNLTNSGECLPYRDYFKFDDSFDVNYNCYDTKGLYGFSVSASGTNSSVEGFDMTLLKSGSSRKISLRTGGNSSCDEVSMIDNPECNETLVIPKSGEVISYIYNAKGENYSSAKIYPVLKSGRMCDSTDSIDFTPCDPGVLGR